MTISDGAATQQPAIDYDQLAAAVQARQPVAPQAPQPSIYQQVLQKHLTDPENHQASVRVIDEMLEAKTKEVLAGTQQSTNFQTALERLQEEIARAVEADEDLGKFAKAVELLTQAEFRGDTNESLARLQKVAQGQFSREDMRKLVNKHFNGLTGAEAKQQKAALTGMKTEVNSQAAAKQDTAAVPTSVKELNEAQREVYYAIVAEKERVGLKQLGLTKEQVEADALKRASAKFKEGRALNLG